MYEFSVSYIHPGVGDIFLSVLVAAKIKKVTWCQRFQRLFNTYLIPVPELT